mgnify:CR=1 FL=1
MAKDWFFTADTHFGHGNIIKYCKRPFLSTQEMKMCDFISDGTVECSEVKISDKAIQQMDETISKSINDVVGKNDNLVIIGDFCHEKSNKNVKYYRDMIECRNIYLILGNHDDRSKCVEHFTACYENYLFNIDGQRIFTSHYPARAWNKSNKGAWMLYGHVHNALAGEDNGFLSNYEKHVLGDGFASVLKRWGLKDEKVVQELLEIVRSTKGAALTLDVGVDNARVDLPFGAPWSMSDIRNYMANKMPLWQARKAILKMLPPRI